MWTPWEPVGAEIESDHVVAVVWRQRLHLFWLTFLEKAQQDTSGEPITLDLPLIIKTAVPKEVEVQLNWCEYFQGEWTTREASGFGRPMIIRYATGLTFKRSEVYIRVSKEEPNEDGVDGVLKIHLHSRAEFPVEGITSPLDKINAVFRVVSKNSPPIVKGKLGEPPPKPPYLGGGTPQVNATRFERSGPLQVRFVQKIEKEGFTPAESTKVTQDILEEDNDFTSLTCANSTGLPTAEIEALTSPFFYQDQANDNTFFVEPTLIETKVTHADDYGITIKIPDELEVDLLWPEIEIWIDKGDPAWVAPIDPLAKFQFQSQKDWLTNAETQIQFDGGWIGQSGSVENAVA